jgi:hypothetical protein
MNTLEFFQRVLPSTGIYVAAQVLPNDKFRHRFFRSHEDLAAYVLRMSDGGANMYYAVSAYRTEENRTQANVRATKVLFLDLDVGAHKDQKKAYLTLREATNALEDFLAAYNLPPPMFVHSGGGLHLYWTLDRELSRDEWKPLALAFKAAAIDFGFRIDTAVPSDEARVLRPVGARNPNYATNNIATVMIKADDVPVEKMQAALAKFIGTTSIVPGLRAPDGRKPNMSLLDAMLTLGDTHAPSDPALVAAQCQQIKWGIDNPDKVSEPFWYDMIGAASACADPENTAIEWSKGYAGFSEEETIAKLMHWNAATSGPVTCAKLENDRPKGCDGCPLKGRISTPCSIGRMSEPAPPPEGAPDDIIQSIPLPSYHKWNKDGGIDVIINDTEVPLCPWPIYPVSYGYDEVFGYEVCRFKWDRPGAGWKELTLRNALLVEGNKEFNTAIADQGIIFHNSKLTGYFHGMLRSYMEELKKLRTVTNLYTTMGWKEDHTQFLLGNTLFKRMPDGTILEEDVTLAGTSKVTDHVYCTAGSEEQWVRGTAIMQTYKMYVSQFMLGISVSSILRDLTGLSGSVVNLWGPTGTGKTITQLWMQSAWGDPKKLHFGAKFTQNAFFTKLGFHNHLPATIDETTKMPLNEVGDFIYGVSQGIDKARLTKGSELREPRTWATTVTTSSNRSFASMLIASGAETDAQQARLLDIPIPPTKLFSDNTDAGRMLYDMITSNYGWVGRWFVLYCLARGKDVIAQELADHRNRFFKKYNAAFTGNERFLEQKMLHSDFALETLKAHGKIQFNYEDGVRHILGHLGVLREVARSNVLDSFDALAEYMNERVSSTITVMYTGAARGVPVFDRAPHDGVSARIDIHRKTASTPCSFGTLTLDRKAFREWMSHRGLDYNEAMSEFGAQNILVTPASNKASMGKDTMLRLPQTYVVVLSLVHPRLSSIINNAEDIALDSVVHQLRVVAD